MIQLRKRGKQGILLATILAALPLTGKCAGILTLDNFDEYAPGLIQGSANTLATAQQGTNGKFLRFGTAVSGGLYSYGSANNGGTGGRGAEADASFSPSTSPASTQYISEFFPTTATSLSSTGSAIINLDIKVTSTAALPNLNAYIQVQDGNNQQFQAAAVSLASASSYQTYSFNFAPGFVTTTGYSQPSADSLAYVLANATQINILFTDTVDTGSPAIDFDNLAVVTGVPEPSTWMMGALSVGFGGLIIVRRNLRSAKAR